MQRTFFFASVFAAGCLGGTAPGDDVAGDPDAGVTPSRCAEVMADAPLAPAGYSYRDALATATRNAWDGASMPGASNASYPGGKYRTINADAQGQRHPGCTTDGLSYEPASIPGYPCAARAFPFPDGVVEDTSKPIVILVHGNSETPNGWMSFVHADPGSITEYNADATARDQLAELLPARGFRTIAVDLRFDKVDDPPSPEGEDTGNTPKNMDHGWATPLVQELVRRVIEEHPDRQISLVGFSLGATVVRDALRRLWVEWDDATWAHNPLARAKDVVLASGTHHGVVSFAAQCGNNFTMRGTVTCEMGQRNQYTQTDFHRALNGPAMPTEGGEWGGWWETPCADGDYAYGKRGVCGDAPVEYTTITMEDLDNGTQLDEFVSEHASRLYPTDCAANLLNGVNDFDTSAYFYNGLFRYHYGAVRSDAGIAKVLAALED